MKLPIPTLATITGFGSGALLLPGGESKSIQRWDKKHWFSNLFLTYLSSLLLGLHLNTVTLHSCRLFIQDQVSGYRTKCSNLWVRSSVSSEGLKVQQLHSSMLRSGEAGHHHHHHHLLGQAAVTFNLTYFALLSTGCFLRAIQNQPAQGKSGCTTSFTFLTNNILWSSFTPEEGAAPVAQHDKDGTIQLQVWGSSPGTGISLPLPKAWQAGAVILEARKGSRATPELLQQPAA